MITRRSLLKLLLASAAAEAVDFEKLLWTPKPIVTVPGLLPNLWDDRYETLDMTRVDVFDRYEYSWKYVLDGALYEEVRKDGKLIHQFVYETTTTIQRG